MRKARVCLALGAAFITTTAHAATLGSIDSNANQVLEREEFSADVRNRGLHGRMDTNTDGELSPGELTAKSDETLFNRRFGDDVFSNWDKNRSGGLDNDEFTAGLYDSYDKDRSGTINSEEFGVYSGDTSGGGLSIR